MYGIVTRNRPELEWPDFDRAFYEVKDVSGRASEPVSAGINSVACFADNAAASSDPTLVPVDSDGARATMERPYFDWSYVCPSKGAYRRGLLETIEACTDLNPDVRLEEVGFPRAEYCRCADCRTRFTASDHDTWADWRAAQITAFVDQASERIPGRTYLTVYPDPYPGRLRTRTGIDLDRIGEHVDEIIVPLYDTAYGTTYWLEALAGGFADRIGAEMDLGVELYAVDLDIDNLLAAMEVVESIADAVYFGYDSSTARAALRRRRAAEREGQSHGGD